SMTGRPASSSLLTKAMRFSALTGIFSFCSPSRAPISIMRMVWLIYASGDRFELGELDTLLHDVADLALDLLQHAREGRAQRLLHLHHFQGQDRRALLQRRALLGQYRHHGAGQGCCDLSLADLFFVIAAKRIDPMQFEAAIARAQIEFMTLDRGHDARC